MIELRIACPAAGYPTSEACYLDVADYEASTGNKFA
jgi:hypothetical protein